MKQKPYRLGRLVIALAVLASCGLVGRLLYGDIDIFADPLGDQLKTIDAAQARWNARSFNAYRLVMAQGDCNYDVEIRNEKVVKLNEDSCKQSSTTISTLFERLKHDTKEIWWVNGTCDFVAVHPTFDSKLGYPQQIEYKQEWAKPENVGGLTYLWTNPLGKASFRSCTLLGMGRSPIIVKSLTPLP